MAKNIKNKYDQGRADEMTQHVKEMMEFRKKHISTAPNGDDMIDISQFQEGMPYALYGLTEAQADAALKQMAIKNILEHKARQREFMEQYKNQFVKFRPDKHSKIFFNDVPSKPHASMKMSYGTIELLGSLWGCSMDMDELELGDEGWDIPTDIIWSGTVSIRDIEFNFSIRDAADVAEISKARIIIDDNYREKLTTLKRGEEVSIGKVLIYLKSHNLVFGTDLIMNGSNPDAFFYAPIYAAKGNLRSGIVLFEAAMERIVLYYLGIWYGVQLAFLHPLTKTCILDRDPNEDETQKPKTPVRKHTKKKNGKKRVLTNVRYQYLDGETLEKVLYNTNTSSKDKKYTRHTQLWHVRGFTRKNGTFVQPYWKGPLAKVKKLAIAEARERAIAGVTIEGNPTDQIE